MDPAKKAPKSLYNSIPPNKPRMAYPASPMVFPAPGPPIGFTFRFSPKSRPRLIPPKKSHMAFSAQTLEVFRQKIPKSCPILIVRLWMAYPAQKPQRMFPA